jgi:hypothetical protein
MRRRTVRSSMPVPSVMLSASTVVEAALAVAGNSASNRRVMMPASLIAECRPSLLAQNCSASRS